MNFIHQTCISCDTNEVVTNHQEASIIPFFSLKPFTAKMNQNSDTGATHNYDNNQAGGFGGSGGVIEINPSIPNLIMVADEAKDSVILYDMTTGTLSAPDYLCSNRNCTSCYVTLFVHMSIQAEREREREREREMHCCSLSL